MVTRQSLFTGLLIGALAIPLSACGEDAEPTPEADGTSPVEDTGGVGPDSTGPTVNDSGQTCDPIGDWDCNFWCLELSTGGGVCVDYCDDSACPDDFACNTIPGDDDDDLLVCLPNADCGELTYEGECEGSVVTYCDFEGPETFNCSEMVGGNDEPMVCGWIEGVGHDCVSSTYGEGCGDVTYDGYCDDAGVLHYCEALETGDVIDIDCASEGLACTVAADGYADCVPEGAEGCGAVTYLGYCDGNVAVWCSDNAVQQEDCGTSEQTCGYIDDTIGFGCSEGATEPTGGAMTVTATYTFEKPALTTDGLGAVSDMPVRHAMVKVMNASDDSEITRTYTDANGGVSIALDTTEPCYLLLLSIGNEATHPFSVRDCPMEDCGGSMGNVYGHQSETFTPSDAGTSLSPVLLTEASGISGAFNIFDLFVKGADFATTNLGSVPPQHAVMWKSGSDTSCQTSCYWKNTVYILSTDADTDEFDDPVLMHEYGHFLEDAYSRSDSPGGDHDGSPTNPLLAWGEGYGTYVGCAIADSSLYIDTSIDGAMVTDIMTEGTSYTPASPGSIQGMKQLLGEYLVCEILWKISRGPDGSDGKGDAPIFDVLGNYFPSDGMVDRGVEGVDLVDFLDGWFCRGHGDQPYIENIVNTIAGFPYDFGGPSSCE